MTYPTSRVPDRVTHSAEIAQPAPVGDESSTQRATQTRIGDEYRDNVVMGSDEHLVQLLQRVQLQGLAERAGGGDAMAGLDAVEDWSKRLSLGEQQRLAFARLIYARPSVAILDGCDAVLCFAVLCEAILLTPNTAAEATSALDLQSEAAMYTLMAELKCTVISVGHRPSLLQHHTHKYEGSLDPWFSQPKGYLRKPRFGRQAQDRASVSRGATLLGAMGLSGRYQTRWFSLDAAGGRLLYFADESERDQKKEISLAGILSVQRSALHDAPPHSIDLVSADRHFTLAAESAESMLRWAYVLHRALRNHRSEEAPGEELSGGGGRQSASSSSTGSSAVSPAEKPPLEQAMAELAEVSCNTTATFCDYVLQRLSHSPDPWFSQPKGYLRKPRFGRQAQDRASVSRGATLLGAMGLGGRYQTRWFSLDAAGGRLLYFADESERDQKKEISLAGILSVQRSALHDAPPHSIDLVSAHRLYTLAAESAESMLRWAYAIDSAVKAVRSRTPLPELTVDKPGESPTGDSSSSSLSPSPPLSNPQQSVRTPKRRGSAPRLSAVLITAGPPPFAPHGPLDPLQPGSVSATHLAQVALLREVASALPQCSGDGLNDDLLADMLQLAGDPLQPSRRACYYPASPAASASVLRLNGGTGAEGAEYMQLLVDSFRATSRLAAVGARHSLTLLSATGSTALDLESSDYWAAVAGLRRMSSGEAVAMAMRCQLSGTVASAGSTAGSLLGLLAGAQREECRLELRTPLVRVTRGATEVLAFDITALRAAALGADWEPVRAWLLEASLNPSAGPQCDAAPVALHLARADGSLCDTSGDGCGVLVLSREGPRDTLVAAVGEQDLRACALPLGVGAGKIALVHVDPISGAERGPACEVNLPFAALLGGPAGTDGTDSERLSQSRLSDSSLGSGPSLEKPLYKQVLVPRPHHGRDLVYRIVVQGRRPPSAYCVVHIVDAAGKPLTVGGPEARSDTAPPGVSPQWQREFLLRLGDSLSAVSAPHAVSVTLRDAASGVLRPRPLGQAIVPIDCFLLRTEADLCLPLEPTVKQSGATGPLGELHVLTQLLEGAETTSLPVTAARGSGGVAQEGTAVQVEAEEAIRHSRPRSSTITLRPQGGTPRGAVVEAQSAVLAFTLRPLQLWHCWWPCRTLRGEGAASGYLRCDSGALVLRLLPGASGALAGCRERGRDDTLVDSCLVNCADVYLPWAQVAGALPLTEAALLLTVTVHRLTSTPSEASRGALRYSSAEVDLLVAPCPAAALALLLRHRTRVRELRLEVAQLAARLRLCPAGEQLLDAGGEQRYSSLGAFIRQHPALRRQWSATEVAEVFSAGRCVAEMLEAAATEAAPFFGLYAQFKQNVNAATASTTESPPVAGQQHYTQPSKQELLLLEPLLRCCRARVYACALHHMFELFAALVRSCSRPDRSLRAHALTDGDTTSVNSLSLPEFSIIHVREFADRDLASARTAGEEASDPLDALAARFDCLLELAVERVRDHALCAAAAWFTTEDGPSGGAVVRQLLEEDFATPASARECLAELVAEYLNKLRLLLFPFIESRETFMRQCPGQALKTGLLRLLVDRNTTFEERVQPVLLSLGLRCNGSLLLLDPNASVSLMAVAEWYSTALVQETRLWLGRTLKEVSQARTNKFELPWDIADPRQSVSIAHSLLLLSTQSSSRHSCAPTCPRR
ncbi:unnamed protein product [Sphagnum balticum]